MVIAVGRAYRYRFLCYFDTDSLLQSVVAPPLTEALI